MSNSKKTKAAGQKSTPQKTSADNTSNVPLQTDDVVRHDPVKSTSKHPEGLNSNARGKTKR